MWNNNINNLAFAQDANGNWGYKIGGADPVIPFKRSDPVQKFSVKSGWSSENKIYFNMQSYVPNYANYNISNFLVQLSLLTRPDDRTAISISYSYKNGIIYVTASTGRIFYTNRSYPATIWFSPN